MRALSSRLRKQLESAVLAARREAERASRAALDGLGVYADKRPDHLDADQAALRNGLRAKWRQLGRDADLLAAECAYEQWHRLLFARFLAENNLLLYPKYHAPVTLIDCEELAAQLDEPDGWSVAARFASEILPGIFRLDDPCVRLRLAPEGRHELEQVLDGLPAEVFVADDALGWIYQYWQKDKKDEVNASERKIGGADLGPVTQLFTENYMVRFLLENSLGAWWAARHPESALVKGFEYLCFDDDGRPAAGSFDGWPDRVADVTVMDPCCGSGHFLVEAFSMLWQMRAEEAGLSSVEAQDAVLRDNLFGLELDGRCAQIAMFAVALHAWKAGDGWRELPTTNVACSGIAVRALIEEWKALADGDKRLEHALARLHVLFRDADTWGSLIDPKNSTDSDNGLSVDYSSVSPALERALLVEADDPASTVLGHAAAGLARAAEILSDRYTLVATNVPYLSRARQGDALRGMAATKYPRSKADLAIFMFERLFAMASADIAVVLPQGWMQLSRYRAFREHFLDTKTLRAVAFLGAGAFSTIAGDVVNVVLIVAGSGPPPGLSTWFSYDVREATLPSEKSRLLAEDNSLRHSQSDTARNPDSRIIPAVLGSGQILAERANSLYGLRTGDGARLIRNFWELPYLGINWRFHQSTTKATIPYAGREHILFWQDGNGELSRLADHGIASIQGERAWGRRGVAVSLMGHLPVTNYTGEPFDNNCAVVWPKEHDDLAALWAFLGHSSFSESVRRIDGSLKVTNQTLLKVPFDLEHWQQVAADSGPLPEPWSDDPTQWLFGGRPEESTAPLQVAVGRLLGYRWPDQRETDRLDAFADADGIVCVPSVAGEANGADRLLQGLAAAYGDAWSPAKLKELLEQTGSKKKKLADWLRDEFFRQHCALFKNRPFVWHIWDGLRDGFSALVNYHRLDRKTLAKLTYSYLGQDWVERQRAEIRDEVPGADARLRAALDLRRKLETILDGEQPHDIYVRWKEPHEQPIGWEPDLNDGVRLNIRPFVEAGVLRSTPNMHWKKDRGKNPDGSERQNNVHLSLSEKLVARRRAGQK